MFTIYCHTLTCIRWFSVPYLKCNAFNCHVVINVTEVYFAPTRGEWKKTLYICRRASVLANQPESQPRCQQITSPCPLRSRLTNYGFLNHVIYQKHVFDFTVHYKTLSDIFLHNYKIYLNPFIKHAGNPQRRLTRNLM
jgi:hypothetical protein